MTCGGGQRTKSFMITKEVQFDGQPCKDLEGNVLTAQSTLTHPDICNTPVCPIGECGDGVLDSNYESCDLGSKNGDTCTSSSMFEAGQCCNADCTKGCCNWL